MIEFEKLPVIKNRIANFNLKYSGELNGYVGPKQYQSHIDFIDGCWFMFQQQQSQQAKIDELKQSIVMQDLFYDQSAEIKNLKLKIDELQKHSLMLRETAKSWSYNEGEKNILISQADDLDRILKGNKDD